MMNTRLPVLKGSPDLDRLVFRGYTALSRFRLILEKRGWKKPKHLGKLYTSSQVRVATKISGYEAAVTI